MTIYGKPIDNYWSFVKKRAKRLLLPVWLFLSIYLSLFYFLQNEFLSEKYLTWNMIWRSFLLLDKSIGYVWIIRVFLLIMLITPLVQRVVKKIKSLKEVTIITSIILVLTQLFVYIANCLNDNYLKIFIVDVLIYLLAYSVPYIWGCWIKKASSIDCIYMFSILLFLFICGFIYIISINENPIDISSKYKYPPQFYYIIYGCLVCSFLWIIKKYWMPLSHVKLFAFVGQNSIWIYLWHMPLALLCGVLINEWWIRFIVIYSVALSIYIIQYRLVSRYTCTNKLKKYLLG